MDSGAGREPGDGVQLTALRDCDCHYSFGGNTFAGFAHGPVGVRGAADTDEHAQTRDRDDDVQCDQSVHVVLILLRVLDPQQEHADTDLAGADRDESLQPVHPPDQDEVLDLRAGEVVHVPAQPRGDFFGHESNPDQGENHRHYHPVVI